jgi:hypothetical protein
MSTHVAVHSEYESDWVRRHIRAVLPFAAYTRSLAFQMLLPGDVVWLVTELPSLFTPAVGARLVVASVGHHIPGRPSFDPRYAQFSWQMLADRALSAYCEPIPWPDIESWSFWRQPGRRAKVLTADQAAPLDRLWNTARRRPLPPVPSPEQ